MPSFIQEWCLLFFSHSPVLYTLKQVIMQQQHLKLQQINVTANTVMPTANTSYTGLSIHPQPAADIANETAKEMSLLSRCLGRIHSICLGAHQAYLANLLDRLSRNLYVGRIQSISTETPT